MPPADVLERICDYFEVSIVFLNTKNHMNTGNGFDPRPYGPAIELSTLNEEPLHLVDGDRKIVGKQLSVDQLEDLVKKIRERKGVAKE